MVLWQPITNLREYVNSKPPGVTFFFCLLILALSFIYLSVYSSTHTLPNLDAKDWNHLLKSMAEHHLCEKNNTITPTALTLPNKEQKSRDISVAFLHIRVPLILASKSKEMSQSVSLQTRFNSSQLQLEGNETYIVSINFTANDKKSCLTITAPSQLLSLRPAPPPCHRSTNDREVVFTEARTVMAPAQKCYSLKSTYDPTLQVMLTKEDQLVAVRHLVEVAVVLLGVGLMMCLSASLTHSQTQRQRWPGQNLDQEPLMDD